MITLAIAMTITITMMLSERVIGGEIKSSNGIGGIGSPCAMSRPKHGNGPMGSLGLKNKDLFAR